jgi:AcrR family transcriptional regulator
MSKADTREKILVAARSVFSEKGYRQSSVEDILQRAHVARATFYKYFRDKRQLYLELVRGLLFTISDEASSYLVDGAGAREMEQVLYSSLTTFYGFLLDNRGMFLSLLPEMFGADPALQATWDEFARRMIAVFENVLQRGIERGEFRELQPRRVSRALLLVLFQAPFNELILAGAPDGNIEAIAAEMVNLALYGIVARNT